MVVAIYIGGYNVGVWDGYRRTAIGVRVCVHVGDGWIQRRRFGVGEHKSSLANRSPTISKNLIFFGDRAFWTAQKINNSIQSEPKNFGSLL